MSILRAWKKLAADESAATAVEYALIVAGLAAVVLVAVYALGGKVKGKYSTVQQNWP